MRAAVCFILHAAPFFAQTSPLSHWQIDVEEAGFWRSTEHEGPGLWMYPRCDRFDLGMLLSLDFAELLRRGIGREHTIGISGT